MEEKIEETKETETGVDEGIVEEAVIDDAPKMTTAALLVEKQAEAKELKAQLKAEIAERKSHRVEDRAIRDSKLENDGKLLSEVKGLIFRYNKLGKVKKAENNVIVEIRDLCKNYIGTECED